HTTLSSLFFYAPLTSSLYTLSLHDALPISPALLARVVDLLDKVPMEERDTKGDVYEYMLGKIATAGQNGQFRTPRHIIRMMVERSEEHTSELQSRFDLVCRLLLEKKKKNK